MTDVRRGRQTPTKGIVLPYTETKGNEAVDLYNATGRTAQEWQELLLYDILARNEEGLWTHDKFGYSVPRRNGKNEIVAIRELWGLKNREHILHTAHRTTTSAAAWKRLCELLDKSKIEYKSIRAMGRESIKLEDGGEVEFRTRSSKGGLGEGFDLLVIDEAQEYTDDQESALKYVVSDSLNPQTLFCGTPPTPVSSGTVFMKLRNAALQGETQNTGWAEWSVDAMTDPHNIDAWYECNPSMGTILNERKVGAEIGSDITDFNIQRLGLWLKYNQKSAISRNEWEGLQCETLPELKGKLFVGVKFGVDGESAAVSIAVKCKDDRIFVETVDCKTVRSGDAWIIDFLRQADYQAVAIDGKSGQQILVDDMKEAGLKKATLPTVSEFINANSVFEQGIFSKTLCHMGQPSVVQCVSNCEKRAIGTGGGFGYRSQIEGIKIEILDSIALAYWLCANQKEPKKQRISY